MGVHVNSLHSLPHVSPALNIQLNLWGLTRFWGLRVNYSLKYARASSGAGRFASA